MRASDVMTANVLTVGPTTSVQELAVLLSQHNISGVPVLDAAGMLVGIVSEGDLLHRAETGTERRDESPRRHQGWFERLIAGNDESARDYVKAHGQMVGDIMSRDIVSVEETTGLDEIADLLETRRIKRVPVVRDGKVVGIVSRANLVRALAATRRPTAEDADDTTIRRRLLTELDGKSWARVWAADIVVKDKTVHLWYSDDHTEEERRALRVAAENTPGVRAVEEHIVRVPMTPAM